MVSVQVASLAGKVSVTVRHDPTGGTTGNFKKLFPCRASLQLLYRWQEKTRFQVYVYLVTSAVNKENQCVRGT